MEKGVQVVLSNEATKEFLDDLTNHIMQEIEVMIAKRFRSYLNKKDLMKRFGIGSETVERMERAGLKRSRLGRQALYDLEDVYAMLDEMKQ